MALFVFANMKYPSFEKIFFWRSGNQKSMSMIGNVNTINKDDVGNYWYVNEISKGLSGMLSKGGADIDMTSLVGKRTALISCAPFYTIIDRCGSMFSNGRLYVMDKNGNEHLRGSDNRYSKIRSILANPNPLQSGKQFNKQVEMTMKTFGFCPIYTLRGLRSDVPDSMWIIPPELFHMEITGSFLNKTSFEDIVKRAWISWGVEDIDLESDEYFIVSDSGMDINLGNTGMIYSSVTDSLSFPINNWVLQMIARGTLIKDGGPKGVLCNDTYSIKDIYGNSSLTSKERDRLNADFKKKYGVVGKLFSVLVTTASLKWIPITGNSEDMKLLEEEKHCQNIICNAIGLNPNVLISDSTYENQNGAKRDAYQDLIIPDSENYCEALTKALSGGEDVVIKLDYSHISVLQEDKKSASSALSLASTALRNLYNDGIMTISEVRNELSNYVDIEPDKPDGELKQKQNNHGQDSKE